MRPVRVEYPDHLFILDGREVIVPESDRLEIGRCEKRDHADGWIELVEVAK